MPREPGGGADDHPNPELLQPLPDDDDRPAHRHQRADNAEERYPEVVAPEA